MRCRTCEFTIEDLIEEDDRVVARWTATGTLTGNGLGLPPTGKLMTLTGMSIARIAGGHITESWNTSIRCTCTSSSARSHMLPHSDQHVAAL